MLGRRPVGRTPDRKDWRLVREVVVAETDEQAFRYAVDGMMGRNMRGTCCRRSGCSA